MGMGDKPDYYQCKTTVLFAKTANAVYKACPQSDCNKKVIDQGDNTYRCEKCNMEFPNFKYRLLLNVSRSNKIVNIIFYYSVNYLD